MPSPTVSRQSPSWLVPTVVIAGAALLIAAIVWLNAPEPDPQASPEATASQGATPNAEQPEPPEAAPAPGVPSDVVEPEELSLSDAERRDSQDLLAIGPVDAPVVLVVFSDYQCPYCARWSAETLPVMMEFANEGDLRIEWRDVNVFGQDSERAARASYAAALQGKFWEYHHELFADGVPRSAGDLSEEALVALATQLGLDGQRFADDMALDATAAEIARNQDLGIGLGAFSTPSFVLGGQPIVGGQPTEVFVDAFDLAYANATDS